MGHSSVPHGLFCDSAPTHLRCAGVPPGLLAPPNAPASAASRPPSEHTVLFLPKRSCFRFASLTLRTAHRSPVSLCFSGRLIFRLRAETFFQKVPVFRMAYSAPTAHCAVSSETLMLQPLRGLRTPHRSIVSSPLAAAAALWLPCVRGAVRRSGLRGCPLVVGGKGKGPAVPFPSLRTEPALRAAPVFRSAYSASRNARPPAASRPPSEHTVLFLPKRSCSRFASLSLRTPHRSPVSSPLAAAAD